MACAMNLQVAEQRPFQHHDDVHLPDAAVWNLFRFLDVQSLCRARQANKLWRSIGADDRLWFYRALETYPRRTVRLEGYGSYEELVKDDNTRHATLVRDLQGLSSLYRSNSASYYCECKLLQLQWCRADDTLRLFFEARGEPDLRRPERSSLTVAVSQPGELRFEDILCSESPSRVELSADAAGHYKGCMVWRGLGAMVGKLQAGPSLGAYCTKEHRTLLQRGAALYFCYANPVPLSGGRVNTIDYSPACVVRLAPRQPLKSGMVASSAAAGAGAGDEPADFGGAGRATGEHNAGGGSGSEPSGGGSADGEPSSGGGSTASESNRGGSGGCSNSSGSGSGGAGIRYELPCEPAQRFASEGREAERRRWSDLPHDVLSRPDWWQQQ